LFFFLSLSKEKEGRESVGVGEAPKRQLLIGLTVVIGRERGGKRKRLVECLISLIVLLLAWTSIIKGRLTATPDVNLCIKFRLWLV
jgi:hypothetical protein